MKNFRRISALFSLIVMLIFAGCDNEPLEGFDLDGDNLFTNSLTGTWTLVDFNNTVNSTTVFNGMTTDSNVVIDGFNPNYDLTFLSNTFSANGSYSYNTEITINDLAPMSDSYTLNNVSGSGNYTVSGNEMTVDGSFFEFTFQGMDLSQLQGEQTITFSISPDGQTLTFTQNTTETGGTGGATTTSVVTGSSVWTKVATNNTTCADASDFATAAANAYNNDNTNVDLCNAYKSALQNQISACGDASGEIQAIIDGLGDCSSGNLLFLQQLITTNLDGTVDTDTFTYEGNKLTSLDSDGYITNYLYENDSLTRINNYDNSGNIVDYVLTEYNANNQLISYTVFITFDTQAFRYDLIYNADNTINVKKYFGDHDTQTTFVNEQVVVINNDQILTETYNTGQNIYTYDNKNGMFKNISNIRTINLINIDFSGYIPSAMNNLLSLEETENGNSITFEEYEYTYNSDDYPESSIDYFGGNQVSTTQYIY